MHLSQRLQQVEIEPVAHPGRAAGERVCSALRSSTKARVSFQLPVSAWIRAITAASSGLRPAAVKLRHYFDVLLKACAIALLSPPSSGRKRSDRPSTQLDGASKGLLRVFPGLGGELLPNKVYHRIFSTTTLVLQTEIAATTVAFWGESTKRGLKWGLIKQLPYRANAINSAMASYSALIPTSSRCTTTPDPKIGC